MKKEGKYYYRYMCTVIFAVVEILTYGIVWYNFARENNVTGHLLGTANLAMSIGIYLILYLLMGRYLRAFKIGVDRKTNLIMSQIITTFTVAVFQIFVSLAVTGQFRFFGELLIIYIVMAAVQSFLLAILVIVLVDIYRKQFPALEVLEIFGEYQNIIY